ncbi:reticulon-1b isoform X1 [Clarias gariepinus]|uniref:reticulon-1b isoform X1 n=1 Tax=Clarias gariepinus TaxID=13013 RepID=UPI00234D03B1|nr:reticulon-1b isoform X1 [Clarias gariepinus]
MSVKPSDEAGSEGGWMRGDELENMELFGKKSSSARFEDEQKQHSHHPPHPVTMETASTDKSGADLMDKPIIDMGDPYTSLLSGYSSQMDTSYFSGDVSGIEKKQQAGIDDLISGLDYQSAMFSSDSGIEMTPSAELGYSSHKLRDSDKTPDSTYNYMDIRSREDPRSEQQPLEDWGISAASEPAPLSNLRGGHYLEKSPSPVEVETLGPSAAALDSNTFPYVEEPSDDELSDYQPDRSPGAEGSASPIKITLTETPPLSVSPVAMQRASPVGVSEKESILSLGLQGVPTVTLSEPEDESPESPTPPLTESDSLSDPMVKGTEGKKASESSSFVSQNVPRSQSPSLELKTTPSLPLYAKVTDASSGDSGDSEIELVSEESSPQAPSSAYMTFSKSPSTPPPAPATTQAPASVSVPAFSPLPGLASGTISAAMQYSILREEREAELDSELALESCEEESPKRFPQDLATKISKENSQQVEPPPPSATVTPAPPVKPAPQPTAPVSDSAPKEKMAREVEDETTKPSSKPSPPSAVLPELKVEQPPEERQAERKHSSTETHPTTPAFFRGITREKAMELLYWRDVKQTGLVFSSVLLLLFSLTQFSVVSVIAYLALAALSATISFRVYKSVLQAVQKTDEGHPFKSYLEMEMSLSHDQMQRYAENTQHYINNTLKELRRLFLVQDLVDSLKFAVVMWLLTYVGALFNGLTLLIMVVVSMFSMPVVYEKYQAQIDQYLGLVRTQVNTVVGKIQEKIPGAKRKAE